MSQEAKKPFWEVLLGIASPEGFDSHATEIFGDQLDVPADHLTALVAYILRKGEISEDKRLEVAGTLLDETVADSDGTVHLYYPEVALTIRELGGYKMVLDRLSVSKPFSREWQACWRLLGEMLTEGDPLIWDDYTIKNPLRALQEKMQEVRRTMREKGMDVG